jgi:hypothetical protein
LDKARNSRPEFSSLIRVCCAFSQSKRCEAEVNSGVFATWQQSEAIFSLATYGQDNSYRMVEIIGFDNNDSLRGNSLFIIHTVLYFIRSDAALLQRPYLSTSPKLNQRQPALRTPPWL